MDVPTIKRPGEVRTCRIRPIVVKHRAMKREELGIHFYANATDGGDWIIRERISNETLGTRTFTVRMRHLSTFRVITQKSRCIIECE